MTLDDVRAVARQLLGAGHYDNEPDAVRAALHLLAAASSIGPDAQVASGSLPRPSPLA